MAPPRDLDAALEALEAALRGTDEQLLIALLGVWRHHRSALVAETIDWLSPELLRQGVAVAGDQQWHLAATRRGSLAVPALIAAPWRRDRPSSLRKKLAALGRLPPDPRIAAFAREVLNHRDQRHGAEASRHEAQTLLASHGPGEGDLPEDPRVGLLLAAVRLRAPNLEQELLAAVLDSPDDDGPRFVYADHLIERGETLGAYIIQALNGGVSRDDVSDGIPAHERDVWCQRFGIRIPWIRFRRGFPYSIAMGGVTPLPVLSSQWSIEQITMHKMEDAEIAFFPSLHVLKNLRKLAIRGSYENILAVFPYILGLKLREFAMPSHAWRPDFGKSADWPRLERLWLWIEGEVRLDEATLGEIAQRPLDVGLVSRARPELVAAIFAAAARGAAPKISTVALRISDPFEHNPSFPEIVLGRTADLLFGSMRVCVDWRSVDHLAVMLRRIEAGNFSSITIESRDHADKAFRARIVRALPRFKHISLAFVPPELSIDGERDGDN